MLKIKQLIADILFLLLISSFIVSVFSFTWEGKYINTGYNDWINMAYRISLVREFGLTHWTHLSGNGHNIWQAYQFIPQILVAEYSKFMSISVTSAMLRVTLVGLIFMYSTMYFLLRKFKVPAFLAFVTTFVAIGVPQMMISIWDFSIFIGLVFVPLFLYLILKRDKEFEIDFVPFAIGVSPYIHPILSFSTLAILVLYNIMNKRFKQLAADMFFIMLLFGFYISGAFFYSGTFYYAAFLDNMYFLRQMTTFANYGISLSTFAFIVIFSLLAFFNIFKLKKSGKNFLMLFSFFIVILVWLTATYSYELPTILNRFQVPRWIPFAVLPLLFGIGLSLSELSKYTKSPRMLKVIALFVFCFFIVENTSNNFLTSISRYSSISQNNYQDPLTVFEQQNNIKLTNWERVYALHPTEVAFYHFNDVRVEGSYYHFLSSPITYLIEEATLTPNYDKALLQTVLNYYKSRGINYIILPSNLSVTTGLVNNIKEFPEIELLDTVEKIDGTEYTVFKSNWKFTDALVYDTTYEFPEFDYSAFEYPWDREYVDLYVNEFANTLSSGVPFKVTYPSQESIYISGIPPKKEVLLLSQYDFNWSASDSNSEKVEILQTGPGYMLIRNDTNINKNVLLTHLEPKSDYYGKLVTKAGLLAWLISFIVWQCYFYIKQKRTIITNTNP
ncbi:MAG: hypothetical protein ACOZAO_04125 [Patescibacteria group bacterium]